LPRRTDTRPSVSNIRELAVENLAAQLFGNDLGGSTRRQPTSGFGANSDRGHTIPAANVESAAVLRRGRSC
jgi:hypothetical protein